MAVFAEARDQIFPGDRGFYPHNLAARNRHIIGIVIAEMQQVAQHLPLDRRQVAIRRTVLVLVVIFVFVLMLVDRFFELLAQGAVAVTDLEELPDSGPQIGPEPAATLRISGGGLGIGHYRVGPLRDHS